MKRLTTKDYEQIKATVQKYINGCLEGKSAIMQPAFHKEAVMFGTNIDGTVAAEGSINTLYGIIEAVGEDKNGLSHIDILDATETTAVVKVTIENWHDLIFIDYHTLMKINGVWTIVAKVYNSYAE